MTNLSLDRTPFQSSCLSAALLLLLAGCHSSHQSKQSANRHAAIVKQADEAEISSTLGKLKALEGTWLVASPDGSTGESVFKVTSAGSAVREVMFPATDHEMTNMYHYR